jgi:hypothetical protein
MAKAELKTKLSEASVTDFLNGIKDKGTREDCFAIVQLMEQATKAKAKMWGSAIIGFGETCLKYESGRELDWFQIGFSPRKANISLYIMAAARETALLEKLGKHKMGKGCLYIKSLKEVDVSVLKQLIKKAVDHVNKKAAEKK